MICSGLFGQVIRRAGPVALFAAILALTACASPPVQEMSDARQTISVAREAGAAEYAAEELKQAEDYLESAQQKLNEQAYKQAREAANKAKNMALDALARTTSAKGT